MSGAAARHDQGGLALSENALEPGTAAQWIGRLVLLGSRIARWSRTHSDQQVVVTVSVPVRDFAAVLIGCGWLMAAPKPVVEPVAEVARSLALETPVRVVTKTKVITDRFRGLDAERGRLRLTTNWLIDRLDAMTVLPCFDAPRSQQLAQPGVINQMAGLAADWAARLASPADDLALIGTLKWLREDISGCLGRGEELEPIANILWPDDPKAATRSTRLFAASRLDDALPLPVDVRAVVLDGATAIKYLRAIETPVVIAVIDRSVADESAAESIVDYRNSRGEPISLEYGIQWQPMHGMEAMAFTVPL
ncbi:MAG: hypothetical protein WKF57_01585 [Nakamurella sp.]